MDQLARDRILARHAPEKAGADRPEPDRLLAPKELANYLGVPVKTLYQWRYKGVGPPGLRIGRHVRYRPEDVEAWLHRVGVWGTVTRWHESIYHLTRVTRQLPGPAGRAG